jgi:hypothetical protein
MFELFAITGVLCIGSLSALVAGALVVARSATWFRGDGGSPESEPLATAARREKERWFDGSTTLRERAADSRP